MAMRHLLVPEAQQAARKHHHTLFTALLLKLGSYSNALAFEGPEQIAPPQGSPKMSSKQKAKKPNAPARIIPLQYVLISLL